MEENKKLTETALLKEAADACLPDFEAIRETCKAELQKERPKTKNARVWHALAAAAAALLMIIGGTVLATREKTPDLPVLPTETGETGTTTGNAAEPGGENTTTPASPVELPEDTTMTAEIERLYAGLFSTTQGAEYYVQSFYVPDQTAEGVPNVFLDAPDPGECPDYQPPLYRYSDVHLLYPSGAPKAEVTDAYREAARQTLVRYLDALGRTIDDLTEVDAEALGDLDDVQISKYQHGVLKLPSNTLVSFQYTDSGTEADGRHPEIYALVANLDDTLTLSVKPGYIAMFMDNPLTNAATFDEMEAVFGTAARAKETVLSDPYVSAILRLVCGESDVGAAVVSDSRSESSHFLDYYFYPDADDEAECLNGFLNRYVWLRTVLSEQDPVKWTVTAEIPLGDGETDNAVCTDFPAVPYTKALELASAQFAADFHTTATPVSCSVFYASSGDMTYKIPVWSFWFALKNQEGWRQRYLQKNWSEEKRPWIEQTIDDTFFYYEVRVPAYDLSSVYGGKETPIAGNR